MDQATTGEANIAQEINWAHPKPASRASPVHGSARVDALVGDVLARQDGRVTSVRNRLDDANQAKDRAERAWLANSENEILRAAMNEARTYANDLAQALAMAEGERDAVRALFDDPAGKAALARLADLDVEQSRESILSRIGPQLATAARAAADLAAAFTAIHSAARAVDQLRSEASGIGADLGLGWRADSFSIQDARRLAREAIERAFRAAGLERAARRMWLDEL